MKRTPHQRSFLRNSALVFGRACLGWMSLGMFASFVLSAVEIVIAFLIQLFLKSLHLIEQELAVPKLLQEWVSTPPAFAVALLSVAAVRAVCQFIANQSGAVSMESTNARLRRLAVFDMLLRTPRTIIAASAINTRMAEHFVKASLFGYAAATFLAMAVQCGGLALVMFTQTPRETLIAMAGLGVLGLAVKRLNRMSGETADLIPRELELLTTGIERIARNSLLVRVLRTEQREHARFVSSIDAYALHSIDSARFGSIAGAVTPLAGVVLIVIIILVGTQVLHTPGLLMLSFLYMFMRFVQALSVLVSQSSNCMQRLPQFTESLRYVDEFSIAEVEAATKPYESRKSAKGKGGGLAPAIVFSGVEFAYEGGNAVFSGLSTSVEAGAQFAIVGPSGTGKSTIIALLLGVESPSAGSVQIGGLTPEAYFARPDVRVGYVGAEAFLIAGTVQDNLLYGYESDGAPEESELWAALALAKLEGVIRALPKGLEHEIGEDGSGLSAGQKQRLCLARALLGEPQLLVLDEASANLDEATELEIAESLSALRGKCTCIVVSHRPGILKYASHTLRLPKE
jgi:ABC-type multidrug transport system fused ATPase/permease subunit